MFKLVEFLKKRPTDLTIRVLRVIGWGSLAALIIATHGQFSLPFASYYTEYEMVAKYSIAGFYVLLAIVFGVLGLCVFTKSTMKKVQMLLWLFLIVLGSSVTNLVSTGNTQSNCLAGSPACTTVSLSEYSMSKGLSTSLPHASTLWIIIGLGTFFGGLTGKMVTSSCIKYREVIKKIRV